jgi:aryl-alcohol dehydrogenase-like predicted oxidoreductase
MIASKVDISMDTLANGNAKLLRDETLSSIEASLKALEVDTVDLMQIHETDLQILRNEEVLRALEDARQQGKIRFIGASCRSERVALAALQTKLFHTLQVPLNILDREMTAQIFPLAAERGIGVLARSIFLRGVLTSNVNTIPERLLPLKKAAFAALEQCKDEVQSLSELALRFSLSYDAVSSVILGVRSRSELESNVSDFKRGPLLLTQVRKLCRISVPDPSLVNPQKWSDIV